MSILDRIVQATKLRVEADKKQGISEQTPTPLESFAFEAAIAEAGMSAICEVKKASPSKGIIAADFPYREIAKEYEAAGAAAISVLTEPQFFLGSDQYLAEIRKLVHIPLLRKDFIVDPFQIEQAHALGADAVLLIAAVLPPYLLDECIKLADTFGMSSLIEVHDEAEIRIALQAGARVIGVNNRNLHDFTVDIANSIRLRAHVPQEILFVSESGIHAREDVRRLEETGINALLVGEALMKSKDKKAALADLLGR